ncbi:MAG: hypothetical protein GC201_15410, partial [Alphaproteobacteria bacterium]|nr:hypothetical protein [Alphaproteobacteria bacterium]
TLNAAGAITGGDGDGVHLGNGSHVYGATTITGYWDGAQIVGSNSSVSASGTITGQHGEGVQIEGSSNTVGSGGVTSVQDGVQIKGSSNTVNTAAINSSGGDGIDIESGSSNTITATSVTGTGGSGANLGASNTLNAAGAITGGAGDGVNLTGGSHVNGATTITGSDDGADISGSGNSVSASGLIKGTGDDGVSISGTSNTVTGGSVQGEDDGVAIVGGGNTVSATAGGITGITGDGVDISGGDGNTVTATGVISGDPGVVITNSNGNTVSGSSISAKNGGVVVSGNSNTISTTSGAIDGNTDNDTTGIGVSLSGNSNTVTSAGAITGQGGVSITGTSNGVSSTSIDGTKGTGTGDGVHIAGGSNTVTTGAISGAGDGIEIASGSSNTITAVGVHGYGGAGALLGSGNTLHAGGAITGDSGVGAKLDGDSHVDGATSITGSTIGADVNGGSNTVTASGTITGNGGIGVDVDGNSNTIGAGGISGSTGGLTLDGLTNNVTVGANGVYGGTLDGIGITGTGNVVTSGGSVTGGNDGVHISGGTNSVSVTGTITGDTNNNNNGVGDGVDISGGDGNNVTATGAITGDPGVIITNSNNNTVSGASISGTNGGVIVTGNGNTISTTSGNIEGNTDEDTTGVGVSLNGTGNTVSAVGEIGGQGGVIISGGGNTVSSALINGTYGTGTGDGVNISGSTNTVTTGAISGDGDGIQIVSGTGNIITATSVTGLGGAGAIMGAGNTLHAGGAIHGYNGDGVNLSGGSTVDGATTITGSADGADLSGDGNHVTASGSIIGQSGDGVIIDGGSNTVSSNSIQGYWDAVHIDGSSNVVTSSGDILGQHAEGVQIAGDSNHVSAAGAIYADQVSGSNDAGVTITGNSNTVSAANVIRSSGGDGVAISGNSNTVSSTNNNFEGLGGDGLSIDGNSNTASAAGAVGYWDGVDINSGTHNNVTIGANGITGLHGQGVDISSDSNEVTSADNIVGATDGVRIGTTGAPASHNTVTATNDITGADGAGVGITGTDNHVTAHDDIQGTSVGIGIVGDSNHVTADDDLSATDGDGVNLDGNGNVIVVGDRISADGDGVNITGNQNNVTFDNIHDTSGDGVQINGDLNDVNVGSAIEVDGNGVWFDSGTGNNVDLRGVTIDAGLDGILVDNAGNTFQHDSATHVIAGENGIEYGYGGTTNAPEALVWYGTIDAAGNGIQTGGDWFSITNHGTINADTDTDQAGTGIVLSSNNYVKNAGDGLITGWNGITGQDYNTIINDGTIDVVNDGIVLHDHNYVENNSNLTIESGDDGIVVNDNNEVVNNGVIHADTDSSGAGTGIVANDHNEISNTGTITGWNGVSIHDSNKLTNDGSIDANNFGVLVTADNNTIDNTNTINGDHAGVRVVYGEDNTITNDDTISGGDEGVQLDNSSNNHIVNNDTITSDGEGINIENNSSDNTVDNYGTVESTGENGEGIEIESNSNGNTVNNYAGATITGWEGVEFEDDATGNTLNNWGTISGAYAIDFEESADSNYVNNYATVTGTYDAVYIDDSYYTEIYNSGSMTGGDYGVEAYYADGTILTNDSTGTISGTGEDGVSFVNSDDVTINNYGSITGGIDGVYLQGENNTVNNYAVDTIQGYSGNGVTIVGDDNTVYNTGAIAGYDEGVAIDGDGNTVDNHDVYATITGQHGDGIDINSGTNNSITNWGTITGHWQGVDNSSGNLTINQYAGTITGQNSDGVRSNTGEDAGLYDTTINNYSVNYGEDGIVGGEIVGATNGVAVGGFDFTLLSGTNSNIQGLDGDGIVTWALTNDIENYGTIQGTEIGIHDYGVTNGGDYDGTTIYNGSTGTITGTRAGYLYEPAGDVQTSASYTDYPSDHTVEIYNYGTISVTGDGTLPDGYNNPPANTEQGTQVSGAVDTTLITGENAAPVAAIDTSRGDASLETYVYNWGVIQGANEFQTPTTGEDGGNTDQSSTVAQADGTIQLTNRFAILGGAGSEYVANFAGGTINGDVALQGNDDSFAMEIGSTFNGNLDMGQTLTDGFVLGPIPDDPATKDVDESKGGTAYGWVASKDQIDTGVDLVTLFGAGGTQNYNGDITEAEVLYVDDRVTESDIINGLSADAVPYPPLPNQPTPDGTWNLNGNVSVDGTHLWKTFAYDSNGDGVADAESDPQVIGTVGTIVNNGRLNIGGTEAVQVQVPVDANKDGVQDTDPDSGDPLFTTETQYVTHTEATLTTPVVDVWSGGTLGGHGTIVTDPGADGGNGGVNLTGKVQGDTEYQVGSQSPTYTVYTPSEARGSLITGTAAGDLVTQGEDGTVTDATKGDGVNDFTLDTSGDTPVKTDIQYTVDSAGKYYPDITLPEGFKSENFDGAFDFTTDSPRYATIAPGDEVNRIGTLTIYGNVNFDSMQTATTTYTVAVADDPATKDVDESKGGTATKDIEGRTVVTNWGSQFQADLKADGAGDQLLVKKTGTTTAITSDTVDTTGPGPVDKVTQDSDGNITDSTKGDGVNDFTVTGTGADAVKTDILEPGKGGPDGVPDGVIYKVSDVSDGHVHLAGRLDIRLDGQFVDEVNNSEPATLPNPDTGCNDAPDGTPNCDPIKNDAHYVPDGIADVNADGIATPTADFTKHATVWDVIVAEGGIDGKFDEKGFDGGANDGAVVTRYPGVTVDDPSTPDVNEGGQPITEVRVQLLKAYLEYLPDRVRIISIPNFANLADSPNQVAIGEYLDTLSQYGLNEDELSGILASLGLTGDIPAGLDALSPEWYNAFNEVGISIAHGAEEQAYVRTIEAQGFSSGQTNRVVMHVGDHSAVGSSANDKRASFWLSAQYGNSHVDSNKGFLEYKYDTVSGYAGFDYLVTPNVLLGILGGFGHSSVDSKNGYDSGKVNNWQIGGYASAFANNWFVNAGGGYGHMSIKSTRDIQFGSDLAMQISEVAQADYNGNLTYLYGKAGYGLDLGNSGWKLSPELGLSYVKVKQDAFTETNAGLLNLAVDRQSVDSLRGTAQLRLSKTFWNGNGGGWMPYVRFGVADEFKDNLRPISANFASSGGSFTIYGDAPRGGASAIFGAGVTGKVSEMFSLYLDYSGEIGSDFKEHIISGGARIHF